MDPKSQSLEFHKNIKLLNDNSTTQTRGVEDKKP